MSFSPKSRGVALHQRVPLGAERPRHQGGSSPDSSSGTGAAAYPPTAAGARSGTRTKLAGVGDIMMTPRTVGGALPAPTMLPAAKASLQQAINCAGDFSKVEQTFRSMLSGNHAGKALLWKAWHSIDYNGNNIVSLAEVDCWIRDTYPVLGNKLAIIRAYKASTKGRKDGYVHKMAFPVLLRDMVFFNKLWDLFHDIDEDDDKHMNFDEFCHCTKKLNMAPCGKNQRDLFNQLDTNRGGIVLFDEFCKWVASVQCPVDSSVYDYNHMAPPAERHRHASPGEVPAAGGRSGGPHTNAAKAAAKSAAGGTSERAAPVSNDEFGALEKRFTLLLKSKKKMHDLWKEIDYNGNGVVSLSEIDKLVSDKFPVLDNKPALIRAYKATIGDQHGDQSAYVHKNKFRALVRNLLYFGRCWSKFELEDTDHDRRMRLSEFQRSCGELGIHLTQADAKEEFDFMDTNGGGMVLFDEFCVWVAAKKLPLE